ncbi:MAG: c-type cytochrome [Gammaproteobacteria bacterium]|nr:c-type cytochrome [Gammaproteobacteria bacterium]
MTQASCSNSEDTAEFNLSKAAQRWSSAEKNWNEDELRALEQGNAIYRKNCAACHGKTGNGDATIGAPSLLNNAVIKGDVNYHIALIRNGKNQMPAFLHVLTDDEILHVAAFERNAWGNHDFSIFDRTGD